MEENNVAQNPLQNSAPQVQQPVQPVENQIQVSKPAGKNKLPLMLIVIFVSLIILGSVAYYYLGLQTKNSNQQSSITPTIIQNSPTQAIDETANPD